MTDTDAPEGTPQWPFLVKLILLPEAIVRSLSETSLILAVVTTIHNWMEALGVPDHELPTSIAVCRSILIVLATLLVHCLWMESQNKKKLRKELQVAQARVRYLQEKLNEPSNRDLTNLASPKKEVRIFMDGAFDMLHYGHMNAFRLARSLGTRLIVGINSDASIKECKGAPLMNDDERTTMVKACKFVDAVVPDCPYIMSPEYLEWVIQEYDIDYVIHGDDPCFVNGKDVYESAKASGKFRTIPRTEGVSTTDIVGRMLLMTKEHHIYDDDENRESVASAATSADGGANDHDNNDGISHDEALGQRSKFLTTSLLLKLFSAGLKAPEKGMEIIYIDGTWDLFHPGHVAVLKAARERGDYLIVGVHGDAVVNRLRGMNLPLMNVHERVLSVLGCRYVDDVLIDAPYEVTPEMIARLNISEVVSGTRNDDIGRPTEENMFRYPKEAGIFTKIESPSQFNISNVFERIIRNQASFQAKFERKTKAEKDFYRQKHFSSTVSNSSQ